MRGKKSLKNAEAAADIRWDEDRSVTDVAAVKEKRPLCFQLSSIGNDHKRQVARLFCF